MADTIAENTAKQYVTSIHRAKFTLVSTVWAYDVGGVAIPTAIKEFVRKATSIDGNPLYCHIAATGMVGYWDPNEELLIISDDTNFDELADAADISGTWTVDIGYLKAVAVPAV